MLLPSKDEVLAPWITSLQRTYGAIGGRTCNSRWIITQLYCLPIRLSIRLQVPCCNHILHLSRDIGGADRAIVKIRTLGDSGLAWLTGWHSVATFWETSRDGIQFSSGSSGRCVAGAYFSIAVAIQ